MKKGSKDNEDVENLRKMIQDKKGKSSSYLVRLAQQVKATWEKAFRKPEKIKYI